VPHYTLQYRTAAIVVILLVERGALPLVEGRAIATQSRKRGRFTSYNVYVRQNSELMGSAKNTHCDG
jgi:hypothetical protein